MSRTRSADYDQIRSGIVETTAALFAARGYAATSIGDIAQACACSKSRLYHYFESKEAILSSMLLEHVETLLQGGSEILGRDSDPVETFRELVRFYLEIYAFSSNKHVVLLTCLEFLPPTQREDIKNKERQLIASVQRVLSLIRPDLHRTAAEGAADAMLFFGMINWTYTWFDPAGTMSAAALAERCIALFLDGYRSDSFAALSKKVGTAAPRPRKRQRAA